MSEWSNDSNFSNVTRPFVSNANVEEELSVSYQTEEAEPTISDSHESYCSSVNRLCLDFTRNSAEDTPSRIIKCESFWRFVDTMPDLEKIRVAGNEVSELESDKSLESTTRVERKRHMDFPWLHMLMKLKEMKLDQTALSGCKENPTTPADNILHAESQSTEECARETMTAIEQFEEDWAKRPRKTNSEAFRLIKQDPARKMSDK